jgi:hypothetical protein
MKKIIYYFLIVGLFLPLINLKAETTERLSATDAYKAVVKINLFSLSEENYLEKISSGSGTIIDPKGIILTNYHVVTNEEDEIFSDIKKDVAYQVCLTGDASSQPKCLYTARLLTDNKDKDIALLQIQNIDGLDNKTVFPYLKIADNSVQTETNIKVLGYPGIGGDTITTSQGIVSGTINKYDINWLKTDANISFGNSGGAGIDSNGHLIGIPTMSHTDMLSSIGYLSDIQSLKDWINTNKDNNQQANILENRLKTFTKKEQTLTKSNSFTMDEIAMTVTKPSNWTFEYSSENTLSIGDESDEDTGFIDFEFSSFPFELTNNDVEWFFKQKNKSFLGYSEIIKKEKINIGTKEATTITYSLFGGNAEKEYFIPLHNIALSIKHDYGNNDKDKEVVDNIINSLNFNNFNSFIEKINYYQSTDHNFSLNFSEKEWSAKTLSSVSTPIEFYKADDKNIAGVIYASRVTGENRNLSNNEIYTKDMKDMEEMTTDTEKKGDGMRIKNGQSYINIGKNINNAMMAEMEIIKNYKIITKMIIYSVSFKNIEYSIALVSMNETSDFEKGKESLAALLKTFEIKDYVPQKITEDVLKYDKNETDDEEISEELEKEEMEVKIIKEQGKSAKEITIKNSAMHKKLKGKIILKTEDKGMAYYVHPQSQKMYYLGLPEDAFALMREQGIGITNKDLEKIPVGISDSTGPDSDKDGLSDLFEDAIGSDKNKVDSDEDGYNDKTEISSAYSPLKKNAKLNYDNKFAQNQAGKILLQVEGNGEAWYINPGDNKRYFLGRPTDAYQAMRTLSLGISNSNFESLK